MTQIEEIRQIIREMGQNTTFHNSEIQEQTDIIRTSVNRVLASLARNGEIHRIRIGLYTGGDLVEFRQKFVSGLFYCGGAKRQYFGITYEANDIIREMELIQEIENAFGNCSDMRKNHGYSSDIFEGEVPRNEKYPNIGVGEL